MSYKMLKKQWLQFIFFYFIREAQHIPAVLKLPSAKAHAQVCFGAWLGTCPSLTLLERVQSKFLRATFKVVLRRKAGLFNVKTGA